MFLHTYDNWHLQCLNKNLLVILREINKMSDILEAMLSMQKQPSTLYSLH